MACSKRAAKLRTIRALQVKAVRIIALLHLSALNETVKPEFGFKALWVLQLEVELTPDSAVVFADGLLQPGQMLHWTEGLCTQLSSEKKIHARDGENQELPSTVDCRLL